MANSSDIWCRPASGTRWSCPPAWIGTPLGPPQTVEAARSVLVGEGLAVLTRRCGAAREPAGPRAAGRSGILITPDRVRADEKVTDGLRDPRGHRVGRRARAVAGPAAGGPCSDGRGGVACWDPARADGLRLPGRHRPCLLYTSDAADEEDSVDLGGRRII